MTASASQPDKVDDPVEVQLALLRDGDRSAQERLFTLVYPELLRIARNRLRMYDNNATADHELVSESYLRLFDPRNPFTFKNRDHFFGIWTRTMYRVLIDHVRQRMAQKRARSRGSVQLTDVAEDEREYLDAVSVEVALKVLQELHPRAAEVVQLRVLGLGMSQVAATLDVSESTARADWAFARCWLSKRMRGNRSLE